jgi:hypothetical protein
MKRVLTIGLVLLTFSCAKKDPNSADPAIADGDSLQQKQIVTNSEGWPQLDLEHYKVYSYTDTIIKFNEPSYLGDHEILEADYLTTEPAVTRTPEGLTFKLKNGELKLLKDNTDFEDEEFVRHFFIRSWPDMAQWQILSTYNESFTYLLIDQTDGTETSIWSDPAFSPDKKYFLTASADIDAGFIPNGFQLWTLKNNKPIKLWEKELTDWGADNLIWTDNNYVVGEQVYRDPQLGESNKRIVKMRIVYADTPKI